MVLRPASTRTAARLRDNLAGLRALESGGPAERLAEAFRRVGFAERSDMQLACRAGLDPADVSALQQELAKAGVLVNLPGIKRELHEAALEDLRDQAQHFLKRWHGRHPSEPGFPAARFVHWVARRAMPGNVKGQKEVGKPLYEHLLKAGTMRVQGTYVCHPEFAPALSGEDQAMLDELLRRYKQSAFQPPTISELRKELGRSFPRAERMINHALSQAQLVRVDSEILLHADVHEQLRQTVRELIESQGPVTVAQIRQALGSTRKYVVPICEHLDRIGFTRRSGDTRTLL
jgi:selenocysteine-specific elongation factor